MQECRMVQISVFDRFDPRGPHSIIPLAEVIVIAPSKEKAIEYGNQELKPWVSDIPAHIITDLGPILFSPIPTTIFLYNQIAGRIK